MIAKKSDNAQSVTADFHIADKGSCCGNLMRKPKTGERRGFRSQSVAQLGSICHTLDADGHSYRNFGGDSGSQDS